MREEADQIVGIPKQHSEDNVHNHGNPESFPATRPGELFSSWINSLEGQNSELR